LSSSNKKDTKNYSAVSTGNVKSFELDKIIVDVKIQIRKLSKGYNEQIQRIGNFLKVKKLVKEEDICAEIKNALRDEIKERLVSSDTIERCCPNEWKRKTKPKDNREPQLRIFEGKNLQEQEEETVTSTNLSVTPEGQVLQQEYKASDSKVSEEQHNQKEKQFLQKIEQKQEQIIKQQQIIKDQETELEKLRPLAEQQTEQSQLTKENIGLKEKLEKLQEENKRLRAGLDESKKEGQLKILVDEWTLSKQLLGLRSSKYRKLHIVIENNKFVAIEGAD
jgi:hypothetical protein